MNINDAIEILKKNIVDQASYYLEAANEFFPFGATIDKNDELRPISVYFGEEHPTSNDVLKKLERTITDKVEKFEYSYAAIGLDVFINTNNSREIVKKPALEIRFYSRESTSKYYFSYFKKRNKYFFVETFNML